MNPNEELAIVDGEKCFVRWNSMLWQMDIPLAIKIEIGSIVQFRDREYAVDNVTRYSHESFVRAYLDLAKPSRITPQ